MSGKVRLDTLLAQRGMFPSRARAAASVLAGEVTVGGREAKPGLMVTDDVELDVRSGPAFVSRGGVKLANALDALGVDVTGRRGMDVGASTGGFTDCLLQRGAERVATVDVAYGELAWSLRSDARVDVLERRNARELRPDWLAFAPDLAVIDVSFIGLVKVLGPVVEVMRAGGGSWDVLALVKPQFELGPGRVGKGGVVRPAADRREALERVGRFAVDSLGVALMGFASSGLPGPKGNRESFAWLAPPGRPGAVDDVAAAARAVEP